MDKYPEIEVYNGNYNLVNFKLPNNYKKLAKSIDDGFKKYMEMEAKSILKQFEVTCDNPNLQWGEDGLECLIIGHGGNSAAHIIEGPGGNSAAHIIEGPDSVKRWVFKNIVWGNEALALFGIISRYMNALEHKK